eukprot:TRINITY_DN32327_c1_g1_i1.p2 TRINITY_DN32327_c1_g1~~TRINITY_DN32327_c1_g1_i1.p2  ORF type:complete len:107 (+),score=17.65 TRINITY_DN32327_c1_g1_i1:143-463(+)
MATSNNGGNGALVEQAQQSVGEWMKAVKCSTHLLLNQWGVNVDEAWMSLNGEDSGDVDKDSMAKQIVKEQVLKQQRQRSLHFSTALRHDEESWSCVMSGMNITSMV